MIDCSDNDSGPPVRAVIFDVYQTLVRVGPALEDAAIRWNSLWLQLSDAVPAPPLAEVSARCRGIVACEHASARSRGIAFPEVVWPEILREAVPELAKLAPAEQKRWIHAHQQCLRTLSPEPVAATLIQTLRESGTRLGIASNAQAYTHEELADAYGDGFCRAFDPDLCFWSYQFGFSKPSPHAFQILAARLAAHGIPPAETLMVGDRMDNDILPARASGWQTWQVGGACDAGGSWADLADWLSCRIPQTAPEGQV